MWYNVQLGNSVSNQPIVRNVVYCTAGSFCVKSTNGQKLDGSEFAKMLAND